MSEIWNTAPEQAVEPPARETSTGGRVALAIAGGVIAAVVGAILWAVIAKVTDHEIGWVALGIGFLVGIVVGGAGGLNPILPVAGGLLAALGCVLGRFFSIAIEVADYLGTSITGALNEMVGDPASTWSVYKASLEPIDLLFVGIAAFEGFVLTRRVAASRG